MLTFSSKVYYYNNQKKKSKTKLKHPLIRFLFNFLLIKLRYTSDSDEVSKRWCRFTEVNLIIIINSILVSLRE